MNIEYVISILQELRQINCNITFENDLNSPMFLFLIFMFQLDKLYRGIIRPVPLIGTNLSPQPLEMLQKNLNYL